MIKRVLEVFGDFQLLSITGLLIFFSIFCGVLWWTGRKETKKLYKELAKLPLRGTKNG